MIWYNTVENHKTGVTNTMKSTGIVRSIDSLGRIVIPKELRATLDIQEKDPVEIFTDGDAIILKKHSPSCIFCGSGETLTLYRDKCVCASCLSDLADF